MIYIYIYLKNGWLNPKFNFKITSVSNAEKMGYSNDKIVNHEKFQAHSKATSVLKLVTTI